MWYTFFLPLVLYVLYRYHKSLSKSNVQMAVTSTQIITAFLCTIYFFGLSATVKTWLYLSALTSALLVIFANYGVPSTPGWQLWLSQVAQGPDFPVLLLSLVLIGCDLGVMDLIGVLLLFRRSIWYLLTQLPTSTGSIFRSTVLTVKALEHQALLMCAALEVSLGLWFVVLLLTPNRHIFGMFTYWNFLRLRYQSPRTKKIHAQTWSVISERAQPLMRFTLFRIVADKVQQWFQSQ